jgi:hypothetical protein
MAGLGLFIDKMAIHRERIGHDYPQIQTSQACSIKQRHLQAGALYRRTERECSKHIRKL